MEGQALITRSRIKQLILVGIAVILVSALLAPCQISSIIWDGRFPSVEYRLSFIDEEGRPIEGVKLGVETQAGGKCFAYPVNEFLPDSVPTSDSNGLMIFHHAAAYLEFSGRDTCNILGWTYSTEGPPKYTCIFVVSNQEVYRNSFDGLYPRTPGRSELPTVRRTWQYSDWPGREFDAASDDWAGRQDAVFDCNADGKLDHEELVARQYYYSTLGLERTSKEIDFEVVERTITIPKR